MKVEASLRAIIASSEQAMGVAEWRLQPWYVRWRWGGRYQVVASSREWAEKQAAYEQDVIAYEKASWWKRCWEAGAIREKRRWLGAYGLRERCVACQQATREAQRVTLVEQVLMQLERTRSLWGAFSSQPSVWMREKHLLKTEWTFLRKKLMKTSSIQNKRAARLSEWQLKLSAYGEEGSSFLSSPEERAREEQWVTEGDCLAARERYFEEALGKTASYLGRENRRSWWRIRRDSALYYRSLTLALARCQEMNNSDSPERCEAGLVDFVRLVNEGRGLKTGNGALSRKLQDMQAAILRGELGESLRAECNYTEQESLARGLQARITALRGLPKALNTVGSPSERGLKIIEEKQVGAKRYLLSRGSTLEKEAERRAYEDVVMALEIVEQEWAFWKESVLDHNI